MAKTVAYLQKSDKKDKKFKVTIVKPGNKNKTVYFGASGYSDFTKHKDKERMKRYDSRHKSRENWTKSGITTAGFWSKWILWSKPSLASAKAYTAKKFNITIKSGKPPKQSPSKSRRKSPKRKTKSRRKSRRKTKSRRKSRRKTKSRRKSRRKKSPKRKSKSTRRKSPKRKSKSRRKSRRKKSPKRKSKSRRRKSVKRSAFSNSGWYIVTKDGCPYCDKAKSLLSQKGINYKAEVANDSNKVKIYKKVDNITNNYRYFPMIFHNGKFIGGYTELEKYNF